MTQDITKEQAASIHTLEDFKQVTGAKRFKRTKEEMDLELSPQGALERRVKAALAGEVVAKPAKKVRPKGAGEILIRIVPEPGMEWDNEWELPVAANDGEIIIQEDSQFFDWLHEQITGPYAPRQDPGGDLLTDIMNMGLGENIIRIHKTEDIEDGTN